MGAHLFLRPEVPGFWPSKGFVGISLTWYDMGTTEEEERMGVEGESLGIKYGDSVSLI